MRGGNGAWREQMEWSAAMAHEKGEPMMVRRGDLTRAMRRHALLECLPRITAYPDRFNPLRAYRSEDGPLTVEHLLDTVNTGEYAAIVEAGGAETLFAFERAS